MVRPTVNSVKHIRQFPIEDITAGTIKNASIVTVSSQSPTGATQVRVGATVKAVYIELWVLANMNAVGSMTITVEKISSGGPAMTFTDSATLNEYANKKNILYTTQGLTPENDGNPVPFLRMWIKIPKGKQRFGLGDSLAMNVSANLEDHKICGTTIFKEYY